MSAAIIWQHLVHNGTHTTSYLKHFQDHDLTTTSDLPSLLGSQSTRDCNQDVTKQYNVHVLLFDNFRRLSMYVMYMVKLATDQVYVNKAGFLAQSVTY